MREGSWSPPSDGLRKSLRSSVLVRPRAESTRWTKVWDGSGVTLERSQTRVRPRSDCWSWVVMGGSGDAACRIHYRYG